jgi:hypothetical protein
MQLVPILSTIILVGTLATFILAVSAYVLYKMREKQAVNTPAAPPAQQQEQTHVLVSSTAQQVGLPASQSAQAPVPASIMSTQTVPFQPSVQPPVQVQSGVQPEPQKSLFWEYTDEGFVPVQPRDESQMGQQMEEEQDDGFAWL